MMKNTMNGVAILGLLLVLLTISIVVQQGLVPEGLVVGRAPVVQSAELFTPLQSANEVALKENISSFLKEEALETHVMTLNPRALGILKSGEKIQFTFGSKKVLMVPSQVTTENDLLLISGKAFVTRALDDSFSSRAARDFYIAIDNSNPAREFISGVIHTVEGEEPVLSFSSADALPPNTIGISAQPELDRHQDPIPAPPIEETLDEEDGSSGDSSNLVVGDEPALIDLLVVYDQAALSSVGGGASGMNAWIALRVAETNQAYVNSAISQRVRLVHAELVDYYSPAGGDHIGRLRGTNDGYMDNVHALRDQFGADLVMLLIPSAPYCGIAYVMDESYLNNTAFAPYGFSVVTTPCGNGWTFSHELGHNMGAHHDRVATGAVNEGPLPDGVSNNPYGFQNLQYAPYWRTVMAYNCPSPGCPRIPHFSNSNVTYNSILTGIAAPSLNAAENWEALNASASTIANFRNTVVPPSVPGAPQNVQASDGTSTGVTVSWSHALGIVVTDYHVYRATTNNANAAQLQGSVGYTNTFLDTQDVTIGQTYYYWVKAENQAGTSAFSNSDSGYGVNPTSVPAAPTNVVATDGIYRDHVTISWNPTTWTTGYRVYDLAQSPACTGTPLETLPASATSFEDYSHTAGLGVNYAVAAYNIVGSSPCSAPNEGYRSNCLGDDPDTGTHSCVHEFDTKTYPDPTSPNTADYSIYSSGTNWANARNATSGSLNNATVSTTTTSTYKNDSALYSINRAFWAFRPTGFPAGTTVISAVVEAYVVNVLDNQNDSSGLFYLLGGQQVDPLVPSADDFSRCPATTANQYGTPVDISTIQISTYNPDYRLTIPVNATGIAALSQAVNNGSFFKLCTREGHDYSNIPPVWNGTLSTQWSKVDTRAYPGTGAITDPAPRLIITYSIPPSATPSSPSNVQATDGTFPFVEVTWTPSAGATNYEVYRSTAGSTVQTFVSALATPPFKDNRVSPWPVEYVYSVRARNENGVSNPSAPDTGYSLLSKARPPAPLNVSATDGTSTSGVTLTWQSAPTATRYTVYRHSTNNPAAATVLQSNIAALSFVDSTPSPGVTMYYWVKALNANGESPFSNGDSGYIAAPACGTTCDIPGSVDLGASCRLTIYSEPAGTGYITLIGSPGQSWDSARLASIGTSTFPFSPGSEFASTYGPISGNNVFTLSRTFIPFPIPAALGQKQILTSNIALATGPGTMLDQANDGFDRIDVMTSTQASGMNLLPSDFGTCALATSARAALGIDIGYVSQGSTIQSPFTSTGIASITSSAGAYARFCVVEGHQLNEANDFPATPATNKVFIQTPPNTTRPALNITYC